MNLRVGFRTFEFRHAQEMPPTLQFASPDEALKWLKYLGSQQSDVVTRLREYAGGFSGDPEFSRLTEEQVLQRLASLLYLRRLVVFAQEQRTTSGAPTPAPAPTPAAFPLSERTNRATDSRRPPPANDPATFGPNLDAAAQASALVAAAAQGQPFCPE